MIAALDRRHRVYNETLELVGRLEQEGRAVVLAQSAPVPIGRFEKDPAKLRALYEVGIRDAERRLQKIQALGV